MQLKLLFHTKTFEILYSLRNSLFFFCHPLEYDIIDYIIKNIENAQTENAVYFRHLCYCSYQCSISKRMGS